MWESGLGPTQSDNRQLFVFNLIKTLPEGEVWRAGHAGEVVS
jgi:hypothetical protein